MTPYYDDGNGIVIYHGSAKDMSPVESGTVHTCVTSPPYWGLRAYCDDPREIGREPTPEDHLANLVDVFREVKRVLRDDGTCFLNYGDAYAATTKGSGGTENSTLNAKRDDQGYLADDRKSQPTMDAPCKFNLKDTGYKPKDLLSMPFRVVDALRRDGWYHRSTIIWSKKSPMPESVQGTRWERCRVKVASGRYDSEQSYAKGRYEPCPGCDKCRDNDGYVLRMSGGRPTTSHEYVFLLTKSPSYFYNLDGNRVGLSNDSGWAKQRAKGEDTWQYNNTPERIAATGQTQEGSTGSNPAGRNLWTVWDDIKQSSFKGAHFATFPLALADRCIRLGTSEYGCCPTCGAQWAPVVETDRQYDHTTTKHGKSKDGPYAPQTGDGEGTHDIRHGVVNKTTIKSWRPTCTCEVNEGGRPLVVDPFSGSCTAGKSAKNNVCDYVGFEINPKYIELSKTRFAQPDLFAAKETP